MALRAWPLWQAIKHNNMAANYNSIARIYDLLSRIIFGSAIVKAQQSFIQFIPANSRLLIVGGGTGKILEYISQLHPTGLVIDYVEVSSGMLGISKKRNYANNKVNFVGLPIEDFKATVMYDVVITPFVLDNFNREKLPLVFNQLNTLLQQNGQWLHTDFVYHRGESPNTSAVPSGSLFQDPEALAKQPQGPEAETLRRQSPWWQKLLLAVMYFFFRITTGIEANELVDTKAYFEKDFSMIFERSFYANFIQAVVYRRK